MFLLRATDPFAAQTVMEYARHCEDAGCSKEHVEAAMDHAYRIRQWQAENPTLVKNLPD